MPIRLKDYGRNQKERKEYVKQSGLLLVGVDVSKVKHDGCYKLMYAPKAPCVHPLVIYQFRIFEFILKKLDINEFRLYI